MDVAKKAKPAAICRHWICLIDSRTVPVRIQLDFLLGPTHAHIPIRNPAGETANFS
jgi:hypothetical protein